MKLMERTKYTKKRLIKTLPETQPDTPLRQPISVYLLYAECLPIITLPCVSTQINKYALSQNYKQAG